MMKNLAKTIDGFLTEDECSKIIDLVSNIEPWEEDSSPFWANRGLEDKNIYNKYSNEVGALLYQIRERIGEKIKELYSLDEIYPDHLSVCRWFNGMSQEPHADDMTHISGGGHEWFEHRDFGGVIYLNDNYSGGHTFYPDHGFEVTPKIGTLAIHPADPNHLHGVTTITGNTRYTISSFWTKDKSFFEDWRPTQ
jgi:hypothetical protein